MSLLNVFKTWWGSSRSNRRRKSSPISGGLDQCEHRLLLSANTAISPAVLGTLTPAATTKFGQLPDHKMHVSPADYSGKWKEMSTTFLLTQSGTHVNGNVTFTLQVGETVSPSPPTLRGHVSGLELHATSHFKLTSMGVTHRETGIIDVHQTDPTHFTGTATLRTKGDTTTFAINAVKA